MALPTTGDTWANVLEPTLNPLSVRKGLITDIIIADYLNVDGTVKRLDLPAAGLNSNGVFTPFAQDNQLRSDLLIGSQGGSYLGGYHIGHLKDSGWTLTPDITVDETATAQGIWSLRNDVTKATVEIMLSAQESGPLNDYLFLDKPLNAGIPDIGQSQYSIPAPYGSNLVERIVIAIGVDGGHLFAITLPRTSRKKVGKWEAQKKNELATDHTFAGVIDPFTKTPFIISRGGNAWTALGGAPIFGVVAPTATAVTGLKATLAFPAPTGLDVGSVTYTATKTTGGVTTPLTLTGSPSVSGGTVTLTSATNQLVNGTSYTLNAIATGDNGAASTSLPSNSITGLT